MVIVLIGVYESANVASDRNESFKAGEEEDWYWLWESEEDEEEDEEDADPEDCGESVCMNNILRIQQAGDKPNCNSL